MSPYRWSPRSELSSKCLCCPGPPKISEHPKNVVTRAGEKVVFRVEVSVMTYPEPTYQWCKQEADGKWDIMERKTSPQLSYRVGPDDEAAAFQCIVQNRLGTVNSKVAKIVLHLGKFLGVN